jgi:hypothetical protein
MNFKVFLNDNKNNCLNLYFNQLKTLQNCKILLNKTINHKLTAQKLFQFIEKIILHLNKDLILSSIFKFLDNHTVNCFFNIYLFSKKEYYEYKNSNYKFLNTWKKKLKIGDRCDAKDSMETSIYYESKWYQSTIISINKKLNRVKVKFDGWSPKFNETIFLNDFSRLLPLFTITFNWKQYLKKDSCFEIKHYENNKWYIAIVDYIDNKSLKYYYIFDNFLIQGKIINYNRFTYITELGTHWNFDTKNEFLVFINTIKKNKKNCKNMRKIYNYV